MLKVLTTKSMKETIILFWAICISLFHCEQSNSKSALCAAERTEQIFIVKPHIRGGGGVFIFNDSLFIDFKEIEISSLEKHKRLFNILQNNPSILKKSNTLEVMLFNDLDTVVIREEEMFSERAILVECERIKRRKSKKKERNN